MFKTNNNWKVVLLSILGATTFWFFNALNKDYDARISYPVAFEFDRDSVVVMEPLASTLKIDVSSGGWNLLRKTFWFNVTPIQIVLENPTEIGFYTRNSLLPLVKDQLSELRINQLITDTVYINIERKRSKKVALSIDSLKIDLADNYRITSPIKLTPDSITLIGPQSFYDTLGRSYEILVTSKGISSDYDRDLDIAIAKHRLIQSQPRQVTAEFSVEKFIRASIEVSLETINFPQDSSLAPAQPTVQIFYTIAESDDDKFSESDFAVTADLLMMNVKDSTVMSMLMYYPEEAMDIEVIPENIRVINVAQ
ncbi:MAG: hypothetical protein JXR10_14215 [Cyclobacteriaceae bacterium]